MDDATLNDLSLRSSTPAVATDDVTSLPTLDLQHVTYEVKEWQGPWWKGACLRRSRHKMVLKDVTMALRGGQITAILGNSGAGKSSLLDVVACRSDGRVSGRVLFRHTPVTSLLMRRYASYVMQADRLLPNLTVRETLRYTAHLRLAAHTSAQEREEKVQEVIMDMGLRHVANSRVGGFIERGISGGEKRRLTIAIQLLQNPEVLLLDEPTTGLDSYTARYLVQSLADLAHRGKLVLLTLHQPRSDIFKMLDSVAILSLGQLTFFGEAGQLVPYFTSIGHPCPQYANPLDKYVDVTSVDRRTLVQEQETTRKVKDLIAIFAGSDLAEHQRRLHRENAAAPHPPVSLQSSSGASWPRIVATLFARMNVNLYRDRSSFVSRILLLPFFAMFTILFLGRLKYTQASIQDRIGLMYQSVSVPPFFSVFNNIPLFPTQRELFYRESRDGLYSVPTFLLAHILHLLPFQVACCSIFCTLVYWIVGMQNDLSLFGMYLAVIFLLHFTWEYIAVAALGLYRNPAIAQTVISLSCTFSVLVASGYLRTTPNLPEVLQWLSWALPHKYAGEIVATNEFHNLNFTCDDSVGTQQPCLTNGDLYLDFFFPGARDHMVRNFRALGGFAGASVVLALVVFKLRGVPNLH